MEGMVVSKEGKFDKSLVESFWSQVDVRGESECWEWKGWRGKNGYGLLKFEGRFYSVHRLSYVLTKGEIPDGLLACHDCDNRACANPGHIWLGTNQDNMDDCKAKRRTCAGSASPNSKLTETQVRTIRERAAAGAKGVIAALAREFGVSKDVISRIHRRKDWAWLDAQGSLWSPQEATTAA